jgi:hypothetical protein
LSPVTPCAFLCEANQTCAAGLRCGADGYCHADGDTTSCNLDARSGTDAGAGCVGCMESGPYNYAFASSAVYVPGSFGGLAGADEKCQTLATNAGLPGHFLAWLSTSTTDARSRFASARGWIRPDDDA